MQSDPIVIVGCARTPMGAFQGELKTFAAPELGAAAIRAAVERAKIRPDEVQEACAGWVAQLFWQTKRDPGLASDSVSADVISHLFVQAWGRKPA